jgi:hypothetical protein
MSLFGVIDSDRLLLDESAAIVTHKQRLFRPSDRGLVKVLKNRNHPAAVWPEAGLGNPHKDVLVDISARRRSFFLTACTRCP